jgi:hypothetical protein
VQISFSINEYDQDGDVTGEGIYLHIGPVRVRVGSTVDELRALAKQLEDIAREIEDPDAFYASALDA